MPRKLLPVIAETCVKDIFFDAMLNGWANPSVCKDTIKELPGSICFKFEKGGFTVVDCYYSNPGSDLSSGHTLIAYEGIPVWTMHYDGFCKKQAISFLKNTLLEAYISCQFIGGRGPVCKDIKKEDRFLVYVNEVSEKSCFASFSGEECVYESDKLGRTCVEKHRYFGRSLIELK